MRTSEQDHSCRPPSSRYRFGATWTCSCGREYILARRYFPRVGRIGSWEPLLSSRDKSGHMDATRSLGSGDTSK